MIPLLLLLVFAGADRPELVAGRLSVLGPTSDIASAVETLSKSVRAPVWVGYAVAMVSGSHELCGSGEVVSLDSERHFHGESDSQSSRSLFVLHRVEGGGVVEIRALSTGCRIDPGPRGLYWWEPVPPGESLRYLRSLALSPKDGDLAEDAVQAAALHFDSRADDLLTELARSAPSLDVRKKAVFWLGAARGEEGYRRLAALYSDSRGSELREDIVFAIHLTDAKEAIPKLIEIARRDPDPEVRERALFWLGQKAGAVAARAIAAAAREDPELEVKKQAIFALSQLPADEGVPLLVEVAETHPHPEVRKQAFFWLGQSDDPRALDFFERVLLRK